MATESSLSTDLMQEQCMQCLIGKVARNMTEAQCLCIKDRQVFYYVLSSLATLGVAIIFVLVPRLLTAPCKSKEYKSPEEKLLVEPSLYVNVQNWAGDLISGNTATGRFLVVFAFICSIAAFVLYIYDTYHFSMAMEKCANWKQSPTLQVDFAFCIFFIVYAVIRFIAAEDKLFFLFSMESLVDFFTIPPVFYSVYLDRSWLGLRFLRAFIFLNLPDVLVYIRVINTSSTIRLAKLCSIFIAVIFGCAGLCFFLENSGDPWHDFSNPHDPWLTYGDCFYYMFVTMSTVGYGDIYSTTDWGRVFIVFYMSGALAMYANYLPEIAQLIGSRPRYAGDYTPDGRQFIIVCGNINYESVQTFLEDFFHPARDDVDVEVVFLNKNEPDLDFEGLLKREHTRVQYLRGSMLNAYDLQRAHADQAAACLVLANKFCEDPDVEDAANIMRVISLKNYCEDTRVIIQLMMYHNKGYLLNIPGWDWRRDDQAVCLNELKLGFIAQSCLAPGFSTLVSNLVIISSPDLQEVLKPSNLGKEAPKWKKDYFTACNKVILAETLSPTFVGMQFAKVAEICYRELNLLLLAIEARKYEGGEIYINPRDKVINPNAIGLFMTDSADSARRAWFYCRKCHAHITNEKQVVKCECKRTAVRQLDLSRQGTKRRKSTHKSATAQADRFLKQQVDYVKDGGVNGNVRHKILDLEYGPDPTTEKRRSVQSNLSNYSKQAGKPRTATSIDVDGVEQSKMQYDSTGMYHWCPSREIEECLMDRQEAAMTVLQNHVIVAVFANPDSPLIGLRNLVMPLRASNIAYKDLLHVVLVGNAAYLKREWILLRNLPKISVLDGSPLSRADLRAVKIEMCRLCVILSAKVPSRVEPVLADKEVLLTALNVKAMCFTDDDVDDEDDPANDASDQLAVPLAEEEEDDILEVRKRKSRLARLAEKRNPILGELLNGSRSRAAAASVDTVNGNGMAAAGVPIIVDLAFATNVRFLDDHELHLDNVELYKTLPFAAGQALARGILDSLMSTTYFNASALRLIRSWVTGGATIELEMALAEGAGLRGGYSTPDTLKARDRFKVAQVPILDSVFHKVAEEGYPFWKLFTEAANKYSMLCIGIYRAKGFEPSDYRDEDANLRIVISAPDKNMPIERSDIAFMLVQFENDPSDDSNGDDDASDEGKRLEEALGVGGLIMKSKKIMQ